MNMSFQKTAAAAGGLLKGRFGKVLLTTTTRWPSSARLTIELSRAGHVVSIVRPAHRHPSQKLRVAHRAFPYSALFPLSALADAIEATDPDIVVPCDDLAVRHLHRLHSSQRGRSASVDIPSLIERSLGPPESFAAASSRNILLEIAREEGILTPESKLIERAEDLDLFSDRPFPWVIKADGTTGGVGVRIVNSLGEARKQFSELRKPKGLLRSLKHLAVNRDMILESDRSWRKPRGIRPAVVAQAYVRGGAANCAVVCWEGEILAGLACEAISTENPVGPATVIRLVDNADMMEAARKIARRLSLSGFFGLDFVIEAGTGAAYLIELNPRCTPPSHLRLGAGRDMIGALSARLAERPFGEPVCVTSSTTIAYFPEALLRKSEHLRSSYHDVPASEPELVAELTRKRFSRPYFLSADR